jgi:ABC-type transport system involved in multi-copper enzyme maturation permease subunit
MNPSLDVSPRKPSWTRTWGALVDADPVLAKELLVTARTPMFVRTIVMAPLLLGALVLLVRAGMNHQLDPVAGRELFPVYFSGLALALGAVGGTLGSTVIVHEREARALEALKFSSLRPRSIVVGKFAAVVLAEVAIVVCTLPLLAFVLAMGGVSLGETFVATAVSLGCGVMTASVGVAVSAHASETRRSLLVSLVASSLIGIGVCIWLAVGSDLGRWYGPFGIVRAYFDAPFDAKYLTVLVVIPAYAVATLLWLGYAAATSGLMDPSEDRGLPLKRWTAGAYATGAFAVAMCTRATGEGGEGSVAGGAMIATGVLATVLLFVFAGEPVRPTRRMQVEARSPLVRAFFPRCLAPSLFFTVAASGVFLLSLPLVAGVSCESGALEFYGIWAVLYLATLGGFLGSMAARRGGTRARRRGGLALVGLAFLVALLHDRTGEVAWVDGICPLWLDLENRAHAQSVMAGSLLAWAVAAVVSFALLVRATSSQSRTPSSAASNP